MNRFPSIRRWGVVAITGVTLFGGLSIVGAGVASAATVPTVSAALTAGATVTTIPGTVTGGGSGNSLTLTVSGTPAVGDQIALTLGCPTTGTASFATVPNSVTTDFPATPNSITLNSAGCSVATFTATGTTPNPTLVLIPTFTTSDVSNQSLTISGTYSTIGQAATNFTVPTDANVSWFSVTSNTPMVNLPKSATTSISPFSITEPANLPGAYGNLKANDTLTLTLPATTDLWASNVTLSTVGGTATLTGTGTNVLTITVNTVQTATGSMLFTLNNPSITTVNAPVGVQNVTVVENTGAGPTTTDVAKASVGNVLGTATTIYGADGTPDGTVAAEFENAYPASSGVPTSGNRNVVLATDAAHTNGSDALAASYLEGTLGTGLLITPATALGADARQAIQTEGVTTVYVVGGPLAVSPAVIAQIQAMPAYNPGGLTLTGSNVKVVGPIYGADGTAEGTAAAIATHFGSAYGSGSFTTAYTSNGTGAYNTTTGTGSTVAPVGAVPTAIVVASTDWQDAMSIAPEAFATRFPVILAGPSSSTTLGTDALAALTTLGVKQVIIVGGQLAVQNTVETQIAALNGGISVLRIAGIDATDTAAQIANFAWSTAGANSGLGWTATSGHNSVIVSHGDYWSDALGAAALGGGANATTFGTEPILLAESPLVIGSYTTKALGVAGALPGGITGLTVLGGPLAMPSSTVNTMLAAL